MLNPPSKRNRDDELLDSPSLDNETFLRPSDVESNYTYLDPTTASFEPKETSQSDGEFDFLDDEAGPMEEGDQVLRLGSPSKTKAKKKGKSNAASGAGAGSDARQKLLKEDSPDEDGKASGRKKIQIAFIEDKSRRHITFSKRKAGIMKKVRWGDRCSALADTIMSSVQAYELSTLTGTQVLLLVVSETGTVFSEWTAVYALCVVLELRFHSQHTLQASYNR